MYSIYHGVDDISDEVKHIQGLEWRRDYDYSMVIPHPTFMVYGIEGTVGDFVYVTDVNRYFKLKISNIYYDYDECLWVWECLDVLHELRSHRISEFGGAYWSGYTPSSLEYKYVSGASNWQTQYVQLLFLIKVMLHHATGVDISDVISTSVDLLYSPYKDILGSYIAYDHLAFCNWQLKSVGLDVYADSERIYKATDLFDILNLILRATNLSVYYYADKYYIKKMGLFSLPADNDVWSYKPQKIESYDATVIKCKVSSNLPDYYADGYDGIEVSDLEDVDETSGSTLLNARKKTFTLPNSFEIHYIRTSVDALWQMSDGGVSFYEQLADLKHDTFGASYTVLEVKTELTKDREPYVNTFIYESDDRKITEQASILKYDMVDTFPMTFPIRLGRT